uniref:Uncharacterized protein n=1 Tax=Nelumbo nucifera TaxID=4432 RepID=A0A822Z3V5_NELNU|nr:TPA_asm: hypothetical protein HUJ06_008992 [Nelumbo nucifera]
MGAGLFLLLGCALLLHQLQQQQRADHSYPPAAAFNYQRDSTLNVIVVISIESASASVITMVGPDHRTQNTCIDRYLAPLPFHICKDKCIYNDYGILLLLAMLSFVHVSVSAVSKV